MVPCSQEDKRSISDQGRAGKDMRGHPVLGGVPHSIRNGAQFHVGEENSQETPKSNTGGPRCDLGRPQWS